MDDALLRRIAEALERLAPPPPGPPDLAAADGFVWHPEQVALVPVAEISRVPLALLQGIASVHVPATRRLRSFPCSSRMFP